MTGFSASLRSLRWLLIPSTLAFIGWSSAVAADSHEYPPLKLRGFGTLSGTLTSSTIDGAPASVLIITCDNEEKAKLVQAKYLSDLQGAPGVKSITSAIHADTGATAYDVKDQGEVMAARDGSTVYILTAASPSALAQLEKTGLPASHGPLVYTSDTPVPMYLDRWDKYGFRFYSYTWHGPQTRDGNGKETYDATYDFAPEFTYARDHDHVPFAIFGAENPLDTAEGLNNTVWWDWETRAAMASGLPFGVKALMDHPSPWLLNRYRDQTLLKDPQYCGGFHDIASPSSGGTGTMSYGSTTGQDAELSVVQSTDRQFVNNPNLLSYLEPHNEMHHGPHDILCEYGPAADGSYREYLKQKYKTLDALNSAQEKNYTSWNDIRVPEVATFVGWGPEALDLTGTWKINYEDLAGQTAGMSAHDLKSALRNKVIASQPAPAEWFSEKFDDSKWISVNAPGNDRAMFMPSRPAVYRRTLNVPADWLAKHPRVWLDVWDLTRGAGSVIKACVNGQVVGETPVPGPVYPHTGYYEATKAIRAGPNQISIRLPKGIFAYRVYLSPDEPKQYPDLGPAKNARWVDFSDWLAWMRVGAVQRGMEMIRQIDPDRPISLGSPAYYADGIGDLAKKYGGEFHNTGAATAFYWDQDPSIMRGLGRPVSLETGSGATDLPGFKHIIGLFTTEGIQGFDYFINIGDIIWNPPIKAYFDEQFRIFKFLGKYHAPRAEIAALYTARDVRLTDFPWESNLNLNYENGYHGSNVRAFLMPNYESDGLRESSFATGDAAHYRVVVDANTAIMDESTVSDIEKYVRDGGVFITYGQTGRHTSTGMNAWPICRLTGYRVAKITPYNEKGEATESQTLQPAPNQDVFTGDWSARKANGLTLEKVAPDVKDLMLWKDGTVAVGMRPLGKGFIIQVGCHFGHTTITNRLETTPDADAQALIDLLDQLMQSLHIARIPAKFENGAPAISFRHFITNNGLFDVWVTWNRSLTDPIDGNLVLGDEFTPAWAIEVHNGESLPVANHRLAVKLLPLETRAFLTPRKTLASAPADWFELQRNWWAGSTPPPDHPLPPPPHQFSVDLRDGWDFKAIKPGDDATTLTAPALDTSSWEKVTLGTWGVPDHADVKDALLRKTFTIPAEWTKGEATFSLMAWVGNTFADKGRFWLDGKVLTDWTPNGVINIDPDHVFKAGTTHTIALEIQGDNSFRGSRGTAWLWIWPDPDSSIDLAGPWAPSMDVMTYTAPVPLPGPYHAYSLYRTAVVPEAQRGKNVVLDVELDGPIGGILINGHWISRFHHMIGNRFHLNITPYVEFGKSNDFELVSLNGPSRGTISKVALNFYDPAYYP
jgi:hypothetical protein